MSLHFPKPKPLRRSIKIELDFFNYATKSNLKNATDADKSIFAKRPDLATISYIIF